MIGHRNVQARERRRQKLKKELDCISVPPSDYQVPKLTLKENFGWRVLEKTHVDSNFPPLMRHYEKPDTSGNFEKVTYVLHMGGPATVVERKVSVKNTQPSGRAMKPEKKGEEVATPKEEEFAPPKPLSPKASYVTWATTGSFEESKKAPSEFSIDSKPTKLIGGFYYTKRKGRSRSRSSKGSKDRNSRQDHAPHNNQKKSGEERFESAKDALLRHLKEERDVKKTMSGDNARMSATVDERKEATRAKFDRIERRDEDCDEVVTRKKPRRRESKKTGSGWQLRAGASETKAQVRMKEESKILENLTITSIDLGRGEPSEELLKTASGTNKYLYVPKKRRSRTSKASKGSF